MKHCARQGKIPWKVWSSINEIELDCLSPLASRKVATTSVRSRLHLFANWLVIMKSSSNLTLLVSLGCVSHPFPKLSMPHHAVSVVQDPFCRKLSPGLLVNIFPSKNLTDKHNHFLLQSTETQCGLANRSPSSRIVGGSETDPNEYPWLAFLNLAFWSGDSATCTGTLIGSRWILTAAHCAYG